MMSGGEGGENMKTNNIRNSEFHPGEMWPFMMMVIFFLLTSSESPTKYSTTPHISFIIRSFGTFLSILMLQIILIMTEYLALHSCSVVLRLGRKPCLAKSPLPTLRSIPNSAANQYLQYYHCCYCYCPALTKLNSLRAWTGSKMSQNGNFRN